MSITGSTISAVTLKDFYDATRTAINWSIACKPIEEEFGSMVKLTQDQRLAISKYEDFLQSVEDGTVKRVKAQAMADAISELIAIFEEISDY